MNACDQHTEQLSAYIDGELDADDHARLATHLMTCASCAEEERELRAIASELGEQTRMWQEPAIRSLPETTEPIPPIPILRTRVVYAAAAALILISGLMIFLGSARLLPTGPGEVPRTLDDATVRRLIAGVEVEPSGALYIRTAAAGSMPIRVLIDASPDRPGPDYRLSPDPKHPDTAEADSTDSVRRALLWLQTMGIDAIHREETIASARVTSGPGDPAVVVHVQLSMNADGSTDRIDAEFRFDPVTGTLLSMDLGPFLPGTDDADLAWIEYWKEPSGHGDLELSPEMRKQLSQLGYLSGDGD